ncbi:MAG: efflux RND transporter periplasmic adaptor subunit [Candidatus Obscuribacterales bacterium]|nr:efflux RND transporter periplasmic adaptor subunit [Candidatus Obscuribacterales bacterium]
MFGKLKSRLKMKSKVVFLLNFGVSSFLAATLLQSCGDKSKENQAAPDESKKSESTSNNKKERRVLLVHPRLSILENRIEVPGELKAYQDVPVHAKVEGYVSWIGVDRGSWVKKGQKMLTIHCPELIQKIDEADAKLNAALAVVTRAEAALQSEKAKLQEAVAKLDSDQLTYSRLIEAAKTPGAIAQNDVDSAAKTVEADRGRVKAAESAISAAEAVVLAENRNVIAARRVEDSLKSMQSYLTISAPFDGVISARNVHEGSIVAANADGNAHQPIVRIQQVSKLRLVAAIPENAVGELHQGEKVNFTAAAFPGKQFEGIVARPAYALDESTRTMPVELNVNNSPRVLDPGMFCTVEWTVSRPFKTIFLPASAVGTDLKGSYVNLVKNGESKRIPVKKGDSMGDEVEVTANLAESDLCLLKASNEEKELKDIPCKIADAEEIKQANAKTEKAAGD